jgi:hypothetical protein
MLFTLSPTPIVVALLTTIVKVSVVVRVEVLGIETETEDFEDVVVIVNALALAGLYISLLVTKELEQLLYECVAGSLPVEVVDEDFQLKMISRETDPAGGRLNCLWLSLAYHLIR